MKRILRLALIIFLLGTALIIWGVSLSSLHAEEISGIFLPFISRPFPHPRTATWIGPPGGAITDLVFDSQSSYTVYAGTDGGGIYRSADGGITWQEASSGLDGLHVTAIAAHPSNPKILYDGTTNGAFSSTNAGATWGVGPHELDGAWVTTIQVDPNNPDLVYFTTNGHSILRLSP